MNFRRWGTIMVAAALVGGGCGGNEEVEKAQEQGRATQKAYAPIQAKMVALGNEIGAAIKVEPDAMKGSEFEGLADRMRESQQEVATLSTPESEVAERDALAAALGKAAATLDGIAGAAEDKDADEVASQIEQLGKDSAGISDARTKYEGALRALTGQG